MINYTHVGTQFQGIIVETTSRVKESADQQSDRIGQFRSKRSSNFFFEKERHPRLEWGGGDFHVRVVSKANEEKTRQGRVKLYLDDEVEDLEAPS